MAPPQARPPRPPAPARCASSWTRQRRAWRGSAGRRCDIIDEVPQWWLDGHRKEPTGRPPGRPKGAKDRKPRARRVTSLPANISAASRARGAGEGGGGEDRSQEQRKHIFAINGSPDFLNVIRDLFQEEHYNVTTTNFVPNSFEQIAALDPDALIVDIAVGQRVGWELLEQLHAEAATTGIPVLIVSTDPRLLERALWKRRS